MKIKPILFSTPMVQAILEGRKTQTRRVVKHDLQGKYFQSLVHHSSGKFTFVDEGNHSPSESDVLEIKPPYTAGDVLWVRETWAHTDQLNLSPDDENYGIVLKADAQPWEDFEGWRWKPSVFMPKAACRLFLKVKSVRVERLQDISEADAKAEGAFDMNCQVNECTAFKAGFETLWQSINGPESWAANPWVWVVEFERCDKPENFV